MSGATALAIDHVYKTYRLGAIGTGTLHEDLSRSWARFRGRPDPLGKVGGADPSRRSGELFHALDNVSFDVHEGEVVGLIGRNGAGKSTLLKVLSQITAPSSGEVRLFGRVASLLEVGTGFHPELTGRENIFLNGAILGMTKAEIRRNFDEIVAFSECGEFIDTPVKRYSSGMYVRLAFAVAAHLESEILIVDEVLAVGDARFQKKCLGKMRDVSRHGRTVIFVSHTMTAVLALCRRAVLLQHGRATLDGDATDVVARYQADTVKAGEAECTVAEMPRTGSGKAKFVALTVAAADAHGQTSEYATPGCSLVVETQIRATAAVDSANVAVVICDANGYRIIDVNTALRKEFLSLSAGEVATVAFTLEELLLKPGNYVIALWLGRGGTEEIDYVENAYSLTVGESTAGHNEAFPGVYQCRFSHHITHQLDADQ